MLYIVHTVIMHSLHGCIGCVCVMQWSEDVNSAVAACASEEFAMPDSLAHYFVIVPSKLRLVTLAAFLMWKCRVSAHRSRKEAENFLCVHFNVKLISLLLLLQLFHGPLSRTTRVSWYQTCLLYTSDAADE